MGGRAIEREEVLRIARLAHLDFDDAELDRITRELAAILEYVKQLRAVPIEGVPPTAHVQLERLPLRPDTAGESLDRERVLAQAPRAVADGFAVPAFVDEG